MITYRDYFSRKVLRQCGVSSSETLLDKGERL